MHYRKIYEDFHKVSLLPNIDIHHIDGNHFNDDIDNLLAVTLEEHFDIHYKQKDWGACQAILLRMTDDYSVVVSEMARRTQNKLLENGVHNFQKMTNERRKEISSSVGYKTLENKLGIHAINADPERAVNNARNAGKISKQKNAGFHDPSKTGGNFVRNTCWWINIDSGERIRCKDAPNNKWKKGMKK